MLSGVLAPRTTKFGTFALVNARVARTNLHSLPRPRRPSAASRRAAPDTRGFSCAASEGSYST